MVCNTCNPSITGRVVTGRSEPRTDVRYKNGHPVYGSPMTWEQRRQYYQNIYGSSSYGQTSQQLAQPRGLEGLDMGAIFVGFLLGFIVGGFVFSRTGRKIMYKSGQRVARRI